MSVTKLMVAGILAFIVYLIIMKFMAGRSGSEGGAADQFKKKVFLTPNELEFLARLEAAAPELRFHSQVAMGALLDPVVSRQSDAKAFYRLRGAFAQKIVDYVAQRRSDGHIVAIIELDDRTHNSEKDAKRDAMLASAGYKTVRWHSKAKPGASAIRAELLEMLPVPVTPKEAQKP
jgi:very-short-patch-repair endonuclease